MGGIATADIGGTGASEFRDGSMVGQGVPPPQRVVAASPGSVAAPAAAGGARGGSLPLPTGLRGRPRGGTPCPTILPPRNSLAPVPPMCAAAMPPILRTCPEIAAIRSVRIARVRRPSPPPYPVFNRIITIFNLGL